MKTHGHQVTNLLLIAAALATGNCSSVPNAPPSKTAANTCTVADSTIMRDGKQGIVLTNDCSTCLAVAFQYIDIQTMKEERVACYVPSETRVVYWQAANPHLLAQKSCEVAKTEGFADIASAAELDADFRSGKCDILGTYAD